MKAKLVLILFLLCNIFFPQTKREFSELRGLEDKNGNTHLFYRIYEIDYSESQSINYNSNHIYHLDLSNNQDTLFLQDYYDANKGYFENVIDFDFWHNDPTKYIYCGDLGGFDAVSFVKRYDGKEAFGLFGLSARKIIISKQNDSLVFASSDFRSLNKSSDGGIRWKLISDPYIPTALISVSSSNDNNIFAALNFHSLNASTDGGNTFIDLNLKTNDKSNIYYDPDSTHIYAVISESDISDAPDFWYLKVSNGIPNFYSFQEGYAIRPQFNKILLTVDNSKSGTIYAAIKHRIYKSTNYGATFTLYKALQRNLIGIYKKPGSEILYAETKFDLMEITPDSIKIIKHIQPPPGLFQWYPLTKSNRWFYKCQSLSFGEYFSDNVIRKVVKDTALSNNKKYSEIMEMYEHRSAVRRSFERVDSTNGIVYKYTGDNFDFNKEIPLFDLTAELHDTTIITNKGEFLNTSLIFYSKDNLKLGEKYIQRMNFKEFFNDPAKFYSLSENIGLSNYGYSGFQTEYSNTLTGCIVNGKVYGDTSFSTVKVNEEELKIKEFSLSQNYPNPFNPVTVISYQLPLTSKVELKVFDILGKEVKTLVNEEKPAGNYQVKFDGSKLSSGIYFYELIAGINRASRKMILIK